MFWSFPGVYWLFLFDEDIYRASRDQAREPLNMFTELWLKGNIASYMNHWTRAGNDVVWKEAFQILLNYLKSKTKKNKLTENLSLLFSFFRPGRLAEFLAVEREEGGLRWGRPPEPEPEPGDGRTPALISPPPVTTRRARWDEGPPPGSDILMSATEIYGIMGPAAGCNWFLIFSPFPPVIFIKSKMDVNAVNTSLYH